MTRNRLAQMAGKYMEYDMIQIHTELPEFPEARIRLLHAMLAYQAESAQHRELLAIVTSLAQMGLDTHDLVENESAAERGGLLVMRARQLKVLAGDYFSGRFYHLLAQAGQVDMIRRIGDAICELNRIKIGFYAKMRQMKLNAEEYLTHGAELKSGLFLSFNHLMTGLYERLWPEIMDRFSRCELLLQELGKLEKPTDLSGSWGFWHVLEEGADEDRRALEEKREDAGLLRQLMVKYSVSEKLSGMLHQTAMQLQSLLARMPSDKLAQELAPLVAPFFRAAAPVSAAATELG
ncbi:heptaprenyl diphosphate synthase component 1 [Cohnella algarum]|uniref:heptaprenyl diphosphate synthase component 1 n=1 Tax=Cohnella algarum TaxID=2044859 RepID=UPI00196786B7|nr:heptaprenyl diphosphate synthase component 1 [Cohnella algarum]MBN2984314.1 heptaprenyl diphosphate synthase component 1 [Cohnella algarum]